jgi:hypothetical protein
VAKYRHDFREFNKFMRGPEMKRVARDVAEKGAQYLRAEGPIGPDPDHEKYRENIEVDTEIRIVPAEKSGMGPRQVGLIVANVSHAASLEFPNRTNPNPQQPMRKMIDYLTGGD